MYLRRTLQSIVEVKPSELGIDTYAVILKKLQKNFEAKCISEGYVRKDSIRLISYTLGKADDPYSGNVRYQVEYSADILFPVTGMILECIITLTTKMGIRAKLNNDSDNPLDILVPRDHYVDDPYYQTLKEGDVCKLEVVANKFKWGAKDIFVLAKINQPPIVPEVAPETKSEEKSEFELNMEPPQFNINIEPETKSVSLSSEPSNTPSESSGDTKAVAFTPVTKKIIRKKKVEE